MSKFFVTLAFFLALSLATEAHAIAIPAQGQPLPPHGQLGSPHFPNHFPHGGALDNLHWFLYNHGSLFGLNWGSNWLHTHVHGGQTPLPAALPLFGMAIAGLAVYRRRKKS
ncbi:MAG TPA: hypothetical protein DD400_05705 [Rhodospirillaceae bacterium]|nr:hypothetical protein [Rhodospirillaceae bacterium]